MTSARGDVWPNPPPEDFDFGMDGGLRVGRPSAEALAEVLVSIFGPGDAPVVVGRQPGVYESTFSSEVLTCRFGHSTTRQLLCKYGRSVIGQAHSSHGHRGGLEREADVYLNVLQPLGVSAAHCYGFHHDPATGTDWLVLEFLDGSARVNKSPDPDAIGLAARWLGRFHRTAQGLAVDDGLSTLPIYDARYYLGWIQRTALLAGTPLHRRFPWLDDLCADAGAIVHLLMSSPTTLIHGEFYPHNVLYRSKTVYPVDWESTARGAGELDLAALTSGWPAPLTHTMEWNYCDARWPDGTPPGFGMMMSAARMMGCFQLLGDVSERTRHPASIEVIETLGTLAAQCGLR